MGGAAQEFRMSHHTPSVTVDIEPFLVFCLPLDWTSYYLIAYKSRPSSTTWNSCIQAFMNSERQWPLRQPAKHAATAGHMQIGWNLLLMNAKIFLNYAGYNLKSGNKPFLIINVFIYIFTRTIPMLFFLRGQHQWRLCIQHVNGFISF